MASKKYLANLKEPDKDLYIQLRQSLDSFCDVVISEFDRSESVGSRKEISDFVSQMVPQLLKRIAVKRQEQWRKSASSRSEAFVKHADEIKESAKPENKSKFAACPPGFIEIDGICVPI